MTSADSPHHSAATTKRFQISLLQMFWWMFVIGAVCAYARLLADTGRASLIGVLLLLAPAIGAAFLLIKDPRTWSAQLAFCALILAYLPGMLLARSYALGQADEGLFAFLLIGAWCALIGGCAVRIYLAGAKCLTEVAVLLATALCCFCIGLMTLAWSA